MRLSPGLAFRDFVNLDLNVLSQWCFLDMIFYDSKVGNGNKIDPGISVMPVKYIYISVFTGSITPTVKLNGLEMKRGEPAISITIRSKASPSYRANYNFCGMYDWRFVHFNYIFNYCSSNSILKCQQILTF